MNHKYASIIVSLVVGIAVALYAYDRATDPEPRLQREVEEAVVVLARDILKGYVAPNSNVEFVDPVDPERKVGKVYISPIADGWEVSGYYRRNGRDSWHPWLMSMDSSMQLRVLSVQDSNPDLIALASENPKFDAVP